MHASNDAELVCLARAGNRDAFGELIRRYQHQIWGLACILLDDRFEAQDATQEASLRAWLNLDLLSDLAKFAPWLRRIVFGVSIDWLRVFRPDLYRSQDVSAKLELAAQPAHTESGLARIEAIELQQRIWDAVARLPPKHRLPLTLFHFDGLMADLAAVSHPLVQISDKPERSLGEVTITETGRNVMEGRADHVQLNGINRWLGGVLLRGAQSTWRWDRERARIVRLIPSSSEPHRSLE